MQGSPQHAVYSPSKRKPVWLDPTHTNKGRADVPQSPVAQLYRYEEEKKLFLSLSTAGCPSDRAPRLSMQVHVRFLYGTFQKTMTFCYTESGVDVYSYGEKKSLNHVSGRHF